MSEREWRERYQNRLTERGMEPATAKEYANAAIYLSDVDPEESADAELSYIMEEHE